MRGRRSPDAGRRHVGVVVALLGTFVPLACDGETSTAPPTTTEAPKPGAEAYGAALATVLDDAPPVDEDRTVVFLVPLADGIGIETQATLIDRFAESYDVRFVDDLAAAVVADDPTHPPRDDGMVVGIGTIDAAPPHLVRLERYRSSDDIDATLLTLEPNDEGWLVVQIDPVPAEVLIDAL